MSQVSDSIYKKILHIFSPCLKESPVWIFQMGQVYSASKF